MEISMHEEQFLYLPLLFDEYRLYVTSSGTNSLYALSSQRKTTRIASNYNNAMTFSIIDTESKEIEHSV